MLVAGVKIVIKYKLVYWLIQSALDRLRASEDAAVLSEEAREEAEQRAEKAEKVR